MNVLITSVGRRNYIVDYFKEALGGRGKVIAVNSIADTSGMIAADEYCIAPKILSDEYISFLSTTEQRLLETIKFICKKEVIELFL